MKKLIISKLFLYKHRYFIGYILLFISFFGLIFTMPLISPVGLSEAEMTSVVDSESISLSSLSSGDLVDLPYHLLQNLAIRIFGFNFYTIKLPSMIIGSLLGILFILLLNRWFKNNVAIISSVLTVLTPPFLYLAGSGTPLIMIIFWPTLLLWLGSKIQGKTLPKTIYLFLFGVCLLGAILTPYMIYLALFIIFYALVHPHLRFAIKSLPRPLFIICAIIGITSIGYLTYSIFQSEATATALFFTPDLGQFWNNIGTAFSPFFTWQGNIESVYLSPMIGIASVMLAFFGLISTSKGFFASRNSIASLLIVYTILISGLNPACAFLSILPLAILTAHGVRHVLEKWYNLFPENPYARFFGLIPIGTFIAVMTISSLSYYIFGYRYSPAVANEFQNDLSLIQENVSEDTTIVIPAGTLEYDFFKILDNVSHKYTVVSGLDQVESSRKIATLGFWVTDTESYQLERIIASPKSQNSDRIYTYIPLEKE